MSKKEKSRGLGRGLSALMSDVSVAATPVEAKKTAKPKAKKPVKRPPKTTPKPQPKTSKAKPRAAKQNGVTSVAIDQLERNPDQPRKYFDKEKLAELTKSISDKGVLQPILVRPLPQKRSEKKKHYQIVAGERRWQAALKAKLDAMPVLIRELSDQDVLEIGVVENVQRADLNPIEEALAYRALSDQFNRTQEDIAQAVGKSRPHITNMLRLLTLPKRAQTYLAKGKITAGHARAIIAAPDPTELADAIAEKGLSVREAEDWVRRIKAADGKPAKIPAQKGADTRKVENDLSDSLGLVTDLRHKGPGGELRIKYRTGDQLEALIKRLKS
ncbi:ParB/RepB/Spo0J family partition protein [Hellea sp.]|nr:ParB/RepB/Spo0J family partition protein [Hellea sp.]